MTRWLSVCLILLASAAPPVALTVDPQPGKLFTATWTGPAAGAGSGGFRGGVALNGSNVELPVVGRAERSGDRLRISAALRYADVPADWLSRFRPDTFDYRVRGDVAGSGAVSWSGTMAWNQVSVIADDRTLSGFVKLAGLELTSLSPRRSEGRAVLTLLNPFSFPIALTDSSYRLRVGGEEVGAGSASGRTLKAQDKNALALPFTVDPMRFFSAVGSAWAVGAPIDSELVAVLTLRLPSGDLRVPLKLRRRMDTSGARDGALSLPDGANTPPPHP